MTSKSSYGRSLKRTVRYNENDTNDLTVKCQNENCQETGSFMLCRLCTRCSTYFCFQCCGLNEQIVKLLNECTDNFWFSPDCAKPALNAIFFNKDIEERYPSFLATVEPRLQNLENYNKSVLDKIKNIVSNTAFNDFAAKKTPD